MDLHHIAKRSSVRLENGNNVINGLLRLLLNAVADQPAMDRVDRTRSANEDEIPGPPSLGISSPRRCTTLSLNHVFGHLLVSP